MTDPYSILGVKPTDSDADIKKAYHVLVKKYHPDRFSDEYEKKKATEKLGIINDAYNTVEKLRKSGENYTGVYSDEGYDDVYIKVRQFIAQNDIFAAKNLLSVIQNRTAQWYYLMGVVFLRQGMYQNAKEHFKTAHNMDPMNNEYATAYNTIKDRAGGFYTNVNMNRSGCATLACVSTCCCYGMGSTLLNSLRCLFCF